MLKTMLETEWIRAIHLYLLWWTFNIISVLFNDSWILKMATQLEIMYFFFIKYYNRTTI
jgi:hypothetical protein